MGGGGGEKNAQLKKKVGKRKCKIEGKRTKRKKSNRKDGRGPK